MNPRALTFNTNARGYDRYRPTYPAALYTAILAYTPLHAGTRVLEIGIGTGQATTPFLEHGCNVTAIDPGDELALFVSNKYAEYANFSAIQTSFEDFIADESYDLIYSATAFHWVDPNIGLPKAQSMLQPGGVIALFWNHPEPQDPVHAAMQPAYERYRPHDAIREPKTFTMDDAAPRADLLREAGFHDVCTHLMTSTRLLSTHEYVGLLNTYSDHLSMNPEDRVALEHCVASVIDEQGGSIAIKDVVELHLGRKHPYA